MDPGLYICWVWDNLAFYTTCDLLDDVSGIAWNRVNPREFCFHRRSNNRKMLWSSKLSKLVFVCRFTWMYFRRIWNDDYRETSP